MNTSKILKYNSKNNSLKSQVTLGINIEDNASHIEVIDNLKIKILKNTNQVKKFKLKLNNLKKFNNKLSDGYQLSLNLIVDISNLLHRYVQVFDMLEIMMKDIETTFEFSEGDFQYIKNLTEKSIVDLQTKMHGQVDSMAVIFEKEGMKKEATEIKKFKETTFEIGTNASKLMTQNVITSSRNTSKVNSSGRNASGRNASGPITSKVNSSGRNASGRNASGPITSKVNSSGRNASGRNASGRNASGRNASGRNASGRNASDRNASKVNAKNKNNSIFKNFFKDMKFLYN